MTQKSPGDVVGIHADKVQIHVATDPRDDGHHSYWTVQPDGKGGATVTVEADFTHFLFRGETFVFNGFRWFPQNPHAAENAEGGQARLASIDGLAPKEGHPLADLRLDDFATMVELGELAPTTNPNRDHEQ